MTSGMALFYPVLQLSVSTWDTELWFYVPLNTKQVILEMFPKPISCLGMEKLNLRQHKHTITNENKCTTTQNKQE